MHEEQLRDIASDMELNVHVGDKAPRSELARSIVQFADTSTENWQWLLRELEEKYTTLLRSDGQLKLSLAMETKLYGILSDVFDSHPIWVRTAVAIATQNLFMDRDYLDDGEKIQEVLAPLTSLPQSSSESLNPLTLPLTHFAALFCKIAGKKGHHDLSDQLRSWLDELLDGTGFSSLSVAGSTAALPKECLWAPAIEIGWNPYTLSRFPEVFIRWAGMRQRVEVPPSNASRRVQATKACELIERDPRYCGIDVDHIELTVTMDSISIPWELKNETTIDFEQPERFDWPVTVRLCPTCGIGQRVEHDGRVLDQDSIVTSQQEDELVAIAMTQGFILTTQHVQAGRPSKAFCVAATKASAAIWSRRELSPKDDQTIKTILHGRTFYELPAVIHEARRDCSKESIWRQTVLLYDPNLPPFEFTISDGDALESTMPYFEINESL